MRRRVWAVLLAAAAGMAGAAVDIHDDEPVATKPASGDLAGRISPAGRVTSMYAVCRATATRYQPSRFDQESGRFVFEGLAGDAAYDLGVVTADGVRLEGIDLSWHEARLLRLAAIRREQLELPTRPAHEFTAEDVRELLGYVRDLKDFCNVRRPLYLKGAGRRATMLVEAMRVADFHARRRDELIWRTELWYFEYRYGGWERVANVERVLERHRIHPDAWRKITLVYYPSLSAYVDQAGRSELVAFEIPQRLNPARGRIAGTEPRQQTEAIIIGVKTDDADSQPAAATRPHTQPAD